MVSSECCRWRRYPCGTARYLQVDLQGFRLKVPGAKVRLCCGRRRRGPVTKQRTRDYVQKGTSLKGFQGWIVTVVGRPRWDGTVKFWFGFPVILCPRCGRGRKGRWGKKERKIKERGRVGLLLVETKIKGQWFIFVVTYFGLSTPTISKYNSYVYPSYNHYYKSSPL